ncbi:MAG: hypothetical protein Kilf2KO_43160 [Rhodospirillales bacterium]
MDFIGATAARANFAALLKRVTSEGRPIGITRRGKPTLALVPLDRLSEYESLADGEAPALFRDRLRETERLAKLGRWEWDEVEGRCTYCSEGLARLAGVTPDDYLKRTASFDGDIAWAHPDDRARYRAAVAEATARHAAFAIEYRFLRANGDVIQVYEESNPVVDEQGNLIASHGFVQDISERKRAEEGLRHHRTLLTQAMRIARMGAWIWDDATDSNLYCSEELAMLFGQTVEEYQATRGQGEGVSAQIHPEDIERYLATVSAAEQARCRYQVEFRERVTDGSYRHFLEVGEPMPDGPGLAPKSVGILQDITELKAAETALRLSEADLMSAQRQARIGSWRWSVLEKRFISCSEEYARIHGVRVEEMVARRPKQVEQAVHPDDRERVVSLFKRVTRRPSEVEYRIVRPDGRVRHVFEISEPIFDDDGRIVEQRGTLQDITDRKAVEQELEHYRDALEQRVEEQTAQLRDSEQRLKEAERIAKMGNWELTAAGGVYWSDEIYRIFGIDKDTKQDKSELFYGLVHPEDMDLVISDLAKGWESGQPSSQVFRILRPNGDIRHVRKRSEYLRDAAGAIVTARGTTQDVTEIVAIESHLRQIQKVEAIGQLTGGIAHDFNNLLAVIQGNVELLEDRLGTDDPLLRPIMHASGRGAELTQRLLAFSRQQPLQPRPTDIAKLMDGMRDLLRRTLGQVVEVEILSSVDLATAVADAGQVENALLNLALNARDAMSDGGRLTIECANVSLDEAYVAANPEATAGDYVMLAVSDQGTGMSPEVKARAFEPFFTTKEVGKGSGLGLSMVYGFAKQSGGHLSIYSEAGRGTTVKLYLPTVEGEAFETDRETQLVQRGQGETILVIEDDDDVRDLAVRLLEDLGYRAFPVVDAAQAHRLLKSGPQADLVLSDVVLPGGVSGPEFAEEIRHLYPDLKVLFMSGYPAAAAMRNGYLGSDKVLLNKPFERRALAQALRNALP